MLLFDRSRGSQNLDNSGASREGSCLVSTTTVCRIQILLLLLTTKAGCNILKCKDLVRYFLGRHHHNMTCCMHICSCAPAIASAKLKGNHVSISSDIKDYGLCIYSNRTPCGHRYNCRSGGSPLPRILPSPRESPCHFLSEHF